MTEQIIKKPSWWNRRSILEKNLLLLLIFSLAVLTAVVLATGALLLTFSRIKTSEPTAVQILNRMNSSVDPCENFYQFACGNFANIVKIFESKERISALTIMGSNIKKQLKSVLDERVEPQEIRPRTLMKRYYKFSLEEDKIVKKDPDLLEKLMKELGRWEPEPEPESISSYNIFGNKIKEQIRQVLEESIQSEETKSLTLGKKYYKACVNEDLIEEQGLEPIKKLLKELGGWPVLEGDSWNEIDFNWKELNYRLRNKGIAFGQLINFYISEDAKNQSQNVFHLYQASMDLPKQFVDLDTDNRILKSYYQFMIDMTTELGASTFVAEKEMLNVFVFQRNLSAISLSTKEMRNASALYNRMTVEELQKLHPYIQWLEYFNNILSPVLQINKTETIINQAPSFFTKLEYLLNNTPNRTIANYILWSALRSTMNALPKEMQYLEQKFLKSAVGISKQEPRWKKCVQSTKKYFELVTGSLYVRKYFDRDSKKKIVEIVDNIRDTFKDDLKKIDWMDSKTKNVAMKKLKSMFLHIAYPDELLDDEKLDEYYKDLDVDENSFLLSILSVNRFWTDDSYRKLREPAVDRISWETHGNVADLGTYYSFSDNSFMIPAGNLQGNLFSSQHPNYMNYGAIGFTIGHEITHGFDNEGRQFNKEGEKFDWWNPNTEKAFLEKAKCIIDQYDNYHVTEIDQNINGELTQGENIADNGGLKLAYFAYKKWLQQNKNQEQQLPGLPYTPLQMFWISMASTWCSLDIPETLKLLVERDVHAPNPFRIIGSVSNRPEFTQDFNCPSGSKMNPKNKCQIW